MKNLKVRRKLAGLLAAGTIFTVSSSTLTGCDATVGDTDIESQYDVIDSQGEDVKILPQVLDVPGEDFKLVVEYSLDENSARKWTITDNKKLYTKVYTQGLPKDVKVYIDNVHTDTSIVASDDYMDGILQDSMDDRIHNSLMLGFPISDDVCYYAVNEIEGQNDSFISGSYYGFYGHSSGHVEERRYVEEDYLKCGVYANEISSAYGLLIQVGDEEPYGVDVSSDIVVLANNTVVKNYESGRKEIKTYDRNGYYKVETIEPEKTKSKK